MNNTNMVLSTRNIKMDIKQLGIILDRYEKLTEAEKEILGNAILEIHSLFNMDPDNYEFDFRFTQR